MRAVLDRAAAPVLTATANCAVPVPVKELFPCTLRKSPEVMLADHAHSGRFVFTSTLNVPPAKVLVTESRDTVYVHAGGRGGACETAVSGRPSGHEMRAVPNRGEEPAWLATANLAVPVPVYWAGCLHREETGRGHRDTRRPRAVGSGSSPR